MRKFLFTVLITFGFQNFAISQNRILVDSLLYVLKNRIAYKTGLRIKSPSLFDSTTADVLIKLAAIYTANNNDTAMQYARVALDLAEAIGYKKGVGNAKQKIGWIYLNEDNYAECLNYLESALKINLETGNESESYGCYFGIGHTYLGKGNYPEALKNYLEALRIAEASQNKIHEARAASGVAGVYSSMGNYAESKKYILRAIHIAETSGDKYQVASSYSLMTDLNIAEKDYVHALEYTMKSLKLSEEINENYSVASDLYTIGKIYELMGNISEAEAYYFKSMKISEVKGFLQLQISVFNALGNIYTNQNKHDMARLYINKGLALSKQIGSLEQIQNSYGNLVKSDSTQGNYRQALKHYRLYTAMGDSIINNENNRKVMQVQMQYDFDKKHVADSLRFSQEKEITELKLQKQKVFTYGGFLGIGITFLLLYFVYRNYNRQRIANFKLKQTQEQLVKSEKMAAFGVVASRMAHEIHNPLNFVNNFSQLSQELVIDVMDSESYDDKKQYAEMLMVNLKKINEHGNRAAGIVKELEELSLKGTAHKYFE